MENQNQVAIFSNEQFGEVRTLMVNNEPYFSLSDVCKVLDIKNSRDAKTRLNEAHVVTTDIGVQTGFKADGSPATQIVSMDFIGEANLYKLIFQSRKAEAQAFADWVTEERKEIIAELNAIKEKQRNAMLIKFGVVAFILLIVVNAIYSKVSDVDMSTIQTASWYQE